MRVWTNLGTKSMFSGVKSLTILGLKSVCQNFDHKPRYKVITIKKSGSSEFAQILCVGQVWREEAESERIFLISRSPAELSADYHLKIKFVRIRSKLVCDSSLTRESRIWKNFRDISMSRWAVSWLSSKNQVLSEFVQNLFVIQVWRGKTESGRICAISRSPAEL